MFRFIHCSDLHLDSPMRGLSSHHDTAPVATIRSATRDALENLVNLCIAEQVAFLVIAGDVFDGDWRDYSTGLFFNQCMSRLNHENIEVYLIRGNHDAETTITKNLRYPPNVHEFSTEQAETLYVNGLPVALHGHGFATRDITQNLAIRYPHPIPDMFNIGVLHTALEGHEGHQLYAPCSMQDLVNKGYDYWALGHVHQHQVLRPSHPAIVFSGNTQGRHIRETGPKGCSLVTVSDTFEVSLEHRTVDVVRWALCTVDLTTTDNEPDFFAAVIDALQPHIADNKGYLMAIRVILTGASPLHQELVLHTDQFTHEIQNAADQISRDPIWIEKVKIETRPAAQESPTEFSMDSLSQLSRILDQVVCDESFIQSFQNDMLKAQRRMPHYMNSPDAFPIESEEHLISLIKESQDILLIRLKERPS